MLDLARCVYAIPSIEFMPSYANAVDEGYQLRTGGPNFSADEIDEIRNRPKDFVSKLLNPEKEIRLPDGAIIDRVPGTTFWLVQEHEFIGSVNIRFKLNYVLERNGGHIGYSVRPQYRRQGAATGLLRCALKFCAQELKLDKALVTCEESNIASAGVIEKCGGRLINILPHLFSDGINLKRYWVPTC